MSTIDAKRPSSVTATARDADVEVIVVGAGFGGLYALHKLKTLGWSVRVYEAGSGIGGTWFWNRYPGARCDNESVEYSYSFSPELQREWRWKERYASQPEILAYLEHVAQRFDLYPHIELETRVLSAVYLADRRLWQVTTDTGAVVTARFCIMATGNLSVSKLPDWPGMDTFAGEVMHTGTWPAEEPDFRGKRVGVIGTGSSGVQVIPHLARAARHLVVFQRTANFAVPANNFTHDPTKPVLDEERYAAARVQARSSFLGFFTPLPTESAMAVAEEPRQRRFEALWQAGGAPFLLAYNDLLVDEKANATAADFVRAKVRALVRHADTAEKMIPVGYPIGAKRLCCEIDYYDTFNRDNVELVDVVREPVVAVTADGVRTTAATYDLDVLVFATGFDAMTGALKKIDIVGRQGRPLAQEWINGPHAYLGLMTVGFPNLFFLTGPGSPSVLSNVVVSIEQHVDWIADCLEHLAARDAGSIEATPEAELRWMDHVDAVAKTTLFPRAKSWYHTLTPDGRRVFMPYVGGVGPYREKCADVAKSNYEGFAIDAES